MCCSTLQTQEILCCYWSLLVHCVRINHHKPLEWLECLDPTRLLNKLSWCLSCLLHHAIAISWAQGTFSLSARPTKTYISAIICKSSCVSPFRMFCFLIPSMRNMQSWGQNFENRQNSRLGFEAVLFEVTNLRPTRQEPLTGSSNSSRRSLKVFRNGSTDGPRSFWQFPNVSSFGLIWISFGSLAARAWPFCGAFSSRQRGPTKRSRQLLRQLCSICKASKANLRHLSGLTWIQHDTTQLCCVVSDLDRLRT